jgi:hypothetical protein
MTINVQVTDDNDNSPIFVQDVYNISIAEGTGQNTAILAISANDKDIKFITQHRILWTRI